QGYTTPFTRTPFLGKTPYRPAPFSIGLFQLRFHPGFPLWRVNSWTLPFGSEEETAYTFPKSFFQILLRGREGAFGMFGYGTAPYILQSVQIECSERGKISPHESNDNLLQILVLKPAVHGLRRTNMSSSNSSEHGSSTFPFQSLPQQSSYSETNLGELSGDGESLCDSNSTAMQSDTEYLSAMDVELFNPEM
ncbi:hypothetical protein NFI96_021679, partial [Prochilodus magdalenae]